MPLQPLPQAKFWTPPVEWQNQPSFMIGGGPSLKHFPFSCLAGKNVIGCNSAYHLGSGIVKYCVFGDNGYLHRNIREMVNFTQMKFVTCAPSLADFPSESFPNLFKMYREMEGCHTGGSTIGWNRNSGALAINLAVSLGSREIYLLGYDLSNEGQVSHWHDHDNTTTKEYSFEMFQRGFKSLQEGLPEGTQVFNVTDGSSRLQVFPRITFEQFHQRLNPQEAVAL